MMADVTQKDDYILVTGGCGYIGSHTVRQLSESGFNVVVIDNLSTGSKNALINGEKAYYSSLTDNVALDKIFNRYNIKGVIHFAASISVTESFRDPIAYYENNVSNTLNLLKYMKRYGVKFLIFSSTAAVYGDVASVNQLVAENVSTLPKSPYGRTKLVCEWSIKDFAAAGDLRYVILRYFNVAGADPKGRMGQWNHESNHLIKSICDVVCNRADFLTIHGVDYDTKDGTGVRDYIHVEDLAAAHISALKYIFSNEESQILNCGYGKGYSVKDILNAFEHETGKHIRFQIGPRRQGDIASIVADNHKIKSLIDWNPKYASIFQIVRDSLNWEQKRQ